LGSRAVGQRCKAAGTRREQRAGGPRVGRFEDFGVDLAEHAAVGDRQRQHAGGRSEAEYPHQHQRPDDLRNCAQEGQQRAPGGAQRAATEAARPRTEERHRQGAGAQDRQRYRDQQGQRDPGGGNRQRLQRRLEQQAEKLGRRRGRQEAGEKSAHHLQVVGLEQRPGPEFGEQQKWPQQHQGKHRPAETCPRVGGRGAAHGSESLSVFIGTPAGRPAIGCRTFASQHWGAVSS
jgi:hypothetical protein